MLSFGPQVLRDASAAIPSLNVFFECQVERKA